MSAPAMPGVLTSGYPSCGYPWNPDCGDGTYSNPVICADYSDPDVIRHGDDFWMTASSFNCTPGLPILHSRDLVNWSLVNHALENVPGDRYRDVQHGCGVWAPAMRFHSGKFWIFFPTPDEGIYQVTTDDPRGNWSKPHLVQAGKGLIDPCPFWDEDGQAYLVHAYAHSRSGLKHRLQVCPMAADGSRLLGEGKVVFHEPDRQPTIEGPKFLKREGWYYILAPAGGVASGWQTVLRSRNVFGPYEDRIVLAQGHTPINGPHQGALVDTPDGEWSFLHFQDAGVYGRVVHLQPVSWRDGWPIMGEVAGEQAVGEPVLRFRKPRLPTASIAVPATSDEFDSANLGRQWQWHANHQDGWYSLTARPGWLRLNAQSFSTGSLAQTANLLLQKFPARSFAVEAALELSSAQAGLEAGVMVAGESHAALALRISGAERQAVWRRDDLEQVLGRLPGSQFALRVEVAEGGRCAFSLKDGAGHALAAPEVFQARPGKWIGAKIGLYCINTVPNTHGGFADFDYFRFNGSVDPS